MIASQMEGKLWLFKEMTIQVISTGINVVVKNWYQLDGTYSINQSINQMRASCFAARDK